MTRPAVVVPIGFLCDHVEVLYDLDVESGENRARVRREDGARGHGGGPSAFIEMMAAIVRRASGALSAMSDLRYGAK